MIRSLIKFEVLYKSRTSVTYLCFALLMIVCFLSGTIKLNLTSETGELKENAPIQLTYVMLVISTFFMSITSWVMGTPILRDKQHQMVSLVHSSPVTKFHFLTGRFLGCLIVLIIIFGAMLPGLMLADVMPFRESARMMPFNAWAYLQIFFVFILPNLFFTGAIFFSSGALSKNSVVVFSQGVILLVAYLLALQISTTLGNQYLAALVDPFGIITFQVYAEHWTITERNSQGIMLEGLVLYNRLLWFSVGVVSLIITYFKFSFLQKETASKIKEGNAERKIRKSSIGKEAVTSGPSMGALYRQALFHVKSVTLEWSFISIVLCSLIVLIYSFLTIKGIYGVKPHASTFLMLQVLDGFDLLIIVIVFFFSGELAWKESETRINQITDSYPSSKSTMLVIKLLAHVLLGVYIVSSLGLIGIIFQILQSFTNIDYIQYGVRLFIGKLILIVSYSALSLFVHSAVFNKYIGYMIVSLFVLLINVLPNVGMDRDLMQYGLVPLGIYSEMNGFSNPVSEILLYSTFWLSTSGIILLLTLRIKGWLWAGKISRILSVVVIAMFIISGCAIFWNTDIQNEIKSKDELLAEKVGYEMELRHYKNNIQPKIKSIHLSVDLYPSSNSFNVKGNYVLLNRSKTSIHEIHVQFNTDPNLTNHEISFGRSYEKVKEFSQYGFVIFKLAEPLQPKDSLQMDFGLSYRTKGFVNGNENMEIVRNGTLLQNNLLPRIGYEYRNEVIEGREAIGLGFQEISYNPNDSSVLVNNMYSDDADYIDLDLVISTEEAQTAIAPGKLLSSSMNAGRSYFHYKSERPIINFFAIASASYQQATDSVQVNNRWVGLEIYYYDGHKKNLARMMSAMKASLRYCSEKYSPYQYSQLRLIEVPRYHLPAQSFSGTICYSESDFLQDGDDKDLDITYGTIAHEVAHQWWGHQITPANAIGQSMLTETLAQYTAMMVLKDEFDEGSLSEFLEYDLNAYLRGRANERYNEEAMIDVISRGYIYYNKGVLAMNSFRNYVGEEKVNMALKNFSRDWAFKTNPYPTAYDLIPYFAQVTPDKFGYVINDLFKSVTIYENYVSSSNATHLSDSKGYKVSIEVYGKKTLSDRGILKEIDMNDWVDLALYDNTGTLIKTQELMIKSGKNRFSIITPSKPTQVVLDPFLKLLDSSRDDNRRILD